MSLLMYHQIVLATAILTRTLCGQPFRARTEHLVLAMLSSKLYAFYLWYVSDWRRGIPEREMLGPKGFRATFHARGNQDPGATLAGVHESTSIMSRCSWLPRTFNSVRVSLFTLPRA